MPRRVRQLQSNDCDLVPPTRYQPKSRLPAQYDELRTTTTTTTSFKPIELDPITNSGPNLPTELDLDDPVAFFRLFFTDHVIQYIVDCTNSQAARARCVDLSARPWKPVLQAEMETYLGKLIKLRYRYSNKYLGAWIWIDSHPEPVLEDY